MFRHSPFSNIGFPGQIGSPYAQNMNLYSPSNRRGNFSPLGVRNPNMGFGRNFTGGPCFDGKGPSPFNPTRNYEKVDALSPRSGMKSNLNTSPIGKENLGLPGSTFNAAPKNGLFGANGNGMNSYGLSNQHGTGYNLRGDPSEQSSLRNQQRSVSPRVRGFGNPYPGLGQNHGYSPRVPGLGPLNDHSRGRFGNPFENRFDRNPMSSSSPRHQNTGPYDRFNLHGRFGSFGANRFNRPMYPAHFGNRFSPHQNSKYDRNSHHFNRGLTSGNSSVAQNSDLRSLEQSSKNISPRFGGETTDIKSNIPSRNQQKSIYARERPARYSNFEGKKPIEGGYQHPTHRFPRYTAGHYGRSDYHHHLMDPNFKMRDRSVGAQFDRFGEPLYGRGSYTSRYNKKEFENEESISERQPTTYQPIRSKSNPKENQLSKKYPGVKINKGISGQIDYSKRYSYMRQVDSEREEIRPLDSNKQPRMISKERMFEQTNPELTTSNTMCESKVVNQKINFSSIQNHPSSIRKRQSTTEKRVTIKEKTENNPIVSQFNSNNQKPVKMQAEQN